VLRVGLTGGIGSGKSEVSRRLVARGAVLIDADLLAREVVEPGTPGLAAIVEAFGREVLLADGALDREALGRIVFADPEQRKRLNAIVHPLVGAATTARFEAALAADPAAIVVHDVPLLVESGLGRAYDAVVVVAARPETQLHRLVALRGMTEADARARMAAQASLEDRLAVATHVIWNDVALDELDAQVDEVWRALVAQNAGVAT
jgi:dephospho-CoA kinase